MARFWTQHCTDAYTLVSSIVAGLTLLSTPTLTVKFGEELELPYATTIPDKYVKAVRWHWVGKQQQQQSSSPHEGLQDGRDPGSPDSSEQDTRPEVVEPHSQQAQEDLSQGFQDLDEIDGELDPIDDNTGEEAKKLTDRSAAAAPAEDDLVAADTAQVSCSA